jgi:hypothetical protein
MGCGGISGGGAGFNSPGGKSMMSGDPSGLGTSGFLGCSCMTATAATALPGCSFYS